MVSRILLALIGVYQRWISPGLGARCRYHPTCSHYAVEAIQELGPLRGSIVAAWRLLRCNPLSDGGIDDLEDRKLFKHAGRSSDRSTSPPPAPLPLSGGSTGPHHP